DHRNPCGDDDTYWVEALFENDGPVDRRLTAAFDIAEALKVNVDELKVYSYNYSRKIRNVDSIGGDAEGAFTILKKVACGDNLDTATDEMDVILTAVENIEHEIYVVLTHGRVVPSPTDDVIEESSTPIKITTTTSRSTTSRTTRKVDNPPVKLNSLSGFTCMRGVYCEMTIPESTFKDVEDGDTFKLRLSVQPIGKKDSWMFYDHKKVKGVPMEEGEHEFRLEARDKAGQMASAPFKVTVKPSFPHNHFATLELDTPVLRFSRPSSLSSFVHQLANAFRSKPDAITIRNVTGNTTKTQVSWSNNTVPHKTCARDALDNIRFTMLTRQRSQTKIEFVKQIGSQFHVRKANFDLLGSCVDKEVEPVSTAPTMEATEQAAFPWMILAGVVLLLLLLAILIVALCSALKRSKKKEKPSDFMGKGMPVVFPDEVAEDVEMAHAATPMLTKEERPPLKVSQHENPLYKPPPPLAAASPRLGSAVPVPNQRMPPSYVPP
ncbi:Dystroglycan, partial [Trichostrongylus colubriformis]